LRIAAIQAAQENVASSLGSLQTTAGVRSMRIRKSVWLGCVLACGASVASAQTEVDRSFTTVSKTCDGIRWSDRAIQTYPTIASACRAVEERDGKTFVKFEGTVRRNLNRGRELIVNFRDGGDVTLTPPPDTRLYIDGRPTPVDQVRTGDRLTFYVAEDRLAAQFPETEAVTTRYTIVPIARAEQEVAEEEEAERTASLPATAGWLPLLGFAAWITLGLAAFLGIFGRRAR
jgi:hypothetical protein